MPVILCIMLAASTHLEAQTPRKPKKHKETLHPSAVSCFDCLLVTLNKIPTRKAAEREIRGESRKMHPKEASPQRNSLKLKATAEQNHLFLAKHPMALLVSSKVGKRELIRRR